MKIRVNGELKQVPDAFRKANLLNVLREAFDLTGTRYGCGVGMCGACTVHIDGEAERACTTSVAALDGRDIVTIEGLAVDTSSDEATLHPVQQAWVDARVPQCGYCQSGQIMNAAALFDANPSPTLTEFVEHMKDVACRCGTYHRILDAYERLVAEDDR
jgi:aerobic-type carbon monoxide dehydrogenase small subunit (CoxS/CutS family)